MTQGVVAHSSKPGVHEQKKKKKIQKNTKTKKIKKHMEGHLLEAYFG